MIFSSAVFLFAFLPVVILLHTAIQNTTARNVLLILASLLFYGWGEPVYILLLIFSIGFNYAMGRMAAGGRRKAAVAAAAAVNLAMLAVFKYAGFLTEAVNTLPFVNLPVPKVRMPIGISFYTFQALSYVIDTYKDEEGRYGSLFDVMLYICLFPQLVAGPIVKYHSVRKQLAHRTVTLEGMYSGIRRFIVGLSKKMLIANTMAAAADKMFALSAWELDMASAWVGAVSYLFQIYFDFSGYSDMAVGMGKIFGFDFPENFDYPYVAVSVRDFWKRWHISLTSWFREYLYFPLGGNRKGRGRTLWNRFFVFLCTGIWHGANLTFLVWGVYHGLLTMAETLVQEKGGKSRGTELTDRRGKGWRGVLGHVYTLLAVTVGFVIFRADTMGQAFHFIGSMFSFNATPMGTMTALSVMSPLFLVISFAAVAACTPLFGSLGKRESAVVRYGAMAGTLVLYALCIMELAAGSYNPFIYFRF